MTAVSTVATTHARNLPRRSARESSTSSSPVAAAPVVAAAGKAVGNTERTKLARLPMAGERAEAMVRRPINPTMRPIQVGVLNAVSTSRNAATANLTATCLARDGPVCRETHHVVISRAWSRRS